MNQDKLIQSYKNDGYIIFDSEADINFANKINELVDSLQPTTFIPYSDSVPWGFGNLIENEKLVEIINLKKRLKRASRFMDKGTAICNHLLITNKPAFIGPDVEWHQEFFNINSYAPGYSIEKDFNKFAQLYMALDEHTIDNGTLYIFEGSHKAGLLPHEDIINNNLNHKRRIQFNALNSLSKKYKLKPLLLKPGQSVLFNHLLVHGSPTNCSPNRRRALLMQFRVESLDKNQRIFDEEVKIRTGFVMNQLLKRYENLKSKNIYADFNKKKNS